MAAVAVFSTKQGVGPSLPEIVYHILEDDEEWGDIVRGDGHSYYPSGFEPRELFQLPGESLEDLEKRATIEADVATMAYNASLDNSADDTPDYGEWLDGGEYDDEV